MTGALVALFYGLIAMMGAMGAFLLWRQVHLP